MIVPAVTERVRMAGHVFQTLGPQHALMPSAVLWPRTLIRRSVHETPKHCWRMEARARGKTTEAPLCCSRPVSNYRRCMAGTWGGVFCKGKLTALNRFSYSDSIRKILETLIKYGDNRFGVQRLRMFALPLENTGIRGTGKLSFRKILGNHSEADLKISI